MNAATAPAWLARPEDAPVAEVAPTPATPVNPEPATPAEHYRSPCNPRTVHYELDMALSRPAPVTLPDDERADLVAQRDALGAKLLAAEAELTALDAKPLPADMDDALAAIARRDADRIVLGKALDLLAKRLEPVQAELARDDAARDEIAAAPAQVAKLKLAAALLTDLTDIVGRFDAAASNFQRLSVHGGPLSGVGALPSVHFQLQDLMGRIGGAMRLLGGVR